MYIEKIFIRNFRTVGENGVTLDCNKGINIILGENNSGKSAIIDALRLALSTGEYKKNIYVKPSDFHINRYGEQANVINIDIFFAELSEDQAIAFYMLTNGEDLKKAELHIEFSIYMDKRGKQRVREDVKGGNSFNSVPREVYDNINLLYLAALRNAEKDLKPSQNSQLANILYDVAKSEDERRTIINAFCKANSSVISDKNIKSVESIINRNLLNIEKDELHEKVQLSLMEPSFESIASLLNVDYVKTKLLKISKKEMKKIITEVGLRVEDIKQRGIYKVLPDKEYLEVYVENIAKYEDLKELYEKLIVLVSNRNVQISQNGLGYNNILHMAATLGNLQKKPLKEEIAVLLVEEPEAHLHPQLLDLLFGFFRKANQDVMIQVFITSHSPTLVAKADIDSIHILRTKNDNSNFVSIKNTSLEEEEKLDLKRYLDVTKSQMFFARRILFVEGISEAILINEFAKLLGKPLDKYSVEIVNINGVAFEPFAKIFQENEKYDFLRVPCAIISDDDRCTNNDDDYRITKAERVYSAINIDELDKKLKKGTKSYRAQSLLKFNGKGISVELAEKTLEYELAKIEENIPLLVDVLSRQHKNLAKDISSRLNQRDDNGGFNTNYEDSDKIAIRIWIAIQDCKGSFAQSLASEISKITSGETTKYKFTVPEYIENAINAILKEEG